MDAIMCDYATGSSALPTSPRGRRIGERRPDGRWEVLCDHRARWIVNGAPACDRDLPAVARDQHDRIPPGALRHLTVTPL